MGDADEGGGRRGFAGDRYRGEPVPSTTITEYLGMEIVKGWAVTQDRISTLQTRGHWLMVSSIGHAV